MIDPLTPHTGLDIDSLIEFAILSIDEPPTMTVEVNGISVIIH